jgi:uncharacterized membrane protein YkvA (DUF1232 family)
VLVFYLPVFMVGVQTLTVCLILSGLGTVYFRSLVIEMFCRCVIAIGGVLFALPIDLLPDFIPATGGMEDVGYVMMAGLCFLIMMRQKTKRQDLKLML